MAKVRSEGFTNLSGGVEESKALANVVFIHGLRGHPRTTWQSDVPTANPTKPSRGLSFFNRSKHRDSTPPANLTQASSSSSPLQIGVFWPEDWLVSDLPEARIWTYGYKADVIAGLFQAQNQNTISQHGEDLARKLEREIDGEKPIIFIVHSLGGIILKKALHESEAICKRTKFIVFLGTPHRGSGSTGWATITSNIVRVAFQDSNKDLVKSLVVNGEMLDSIHKEFKKLAQEHHLQCHSFQEAQAMTGIKGLDDKVVPDFSSKLDLQSELEKVERINGNHRTMVRFGSRDDEGYRAISGVLKKFVREKLKLIQATESDKLIWTVPHPRNNSFVGRETALAALKQRFEQEAPDRHARVAITGLGGVGKSQTANEFAYRVRDSNAKISVFWVHAGTFASIERSYKNIAKTVRIEGWDDPKAEIFEIVCDWLRNENNGRWLLVLDSADDKRIFSHAVGTTGSLLESYLPDSSNGWILVTSRNQNAALRLVETAQTVRDVIPLDALQEEDALLLLKNKTEVTDTNEPDARRLVQTLEGIPLAITHAAAFLKYNAYAYTISGYLKSILKSEEKRVEFLNRDVNIPPGVIITWQISFNLIRETAAEAADLLALMAMFDNQQIPGRLLRENRDDDEFWKVAMTLIDFSLIKRQNSQQPDIEVDNRLFDMHSLVQLATKDWLKLQGELEPWERKSLDSMINQFPHANVNDRKSMNICQLLLPHARITLTYTSKDKAEEFERGELAMKVGGYLLILGMYQGVEELTHRGYEEIKNSMGSSHMAAIGALEVLARVQATQGKCKLAQAGQEKVLKLLEEKFPQGHARTFEVSSDLGSIYLDQGRYAEAVVYHRKAVAGFEMLAEPDQNDVCCAQIQLAACLAYQRNFAEAEKIFIPAVGNLRQSLGDRHLNTVIGMSNLAGLYMAQGEYVKASELFKQCAEYREEINGRDHHHTLIVRSRFIICLWHLDENIEAERELRYCLDKLDEILGAEHKETLSVAYNLALVLFTLSRYTKAEKLFVRAIKGWTKKEKKEEKQEMRQSRKE